MLERILHEVAHRVRRARGEDVVGGFVGLKHAPHALDVLLGEAPVACCVEVAEVEGVLQPQADPRGRHRDLARDEGLPAAR